MGRLAQLLVLAFSLVLMIQGSFASYSLSANCTNLRRNISEPLEGQRQTNQRAELTGILRALEIVPRNKPIEIITDSNYSINCATDWYKNWIRNDWKTSTGKVVENRDLVQAIRKLIDERGKVLTKFTWVKGHDNDPGNVAADRLAVAGAMAKR
jgi:ribonuclease HI